MSSDTAKGSIEEAALRYLSTRGRTVREMERHLLQKGFDEEDIRVLTAEYRRLGYLDDAQYCRQYIRYALGKGKGRRRILCELREKGVEPSLAEFAFEDFLEEEAIDYNEKSRAFAEAEKVIRAAGISPEAPLPEKLLGRIGRRLQSKGYGSDVIYGVLGRLRKADREE